MTSMSSAYEMPTGRSPIQSCMPLAWHASPNARSDLNASSGYGERQSTFWYGSSFGA